LFEILEANCNTSKQELGPFLYSREIPYNVWLHLAVTWNQGLKLAKTFINGTVSARKVADSKKTSYKLMNNSHSFYQIGVKKDSGETFHGLVKNLKVFTRVLSSNEIMKEMSGMLSA